MIDSRFVWSDDDVALTPVAQSATILQFPALLKAENVPPEGYYYDKKVGRTFKRLPVGFNWEKDRHRVDQYAKAVHDWLQGGKRNLAKLLRRQAKLEKFNENHDDKGRFASSPGGGGDPAGDAQSNRMREVISRIENAPKMPALPEGFPKDQEAGVKGIYEYLKTSSAMQPTHEGMEGPAERIMKYGEPYYFDAKSFEGKRSTPKQCYKNCADKVMDGNSKLRYVEGYVTVHGVPISHAWLTDGNNHVLDPTLKGEDVKGYYGIKFKSDYVRRTALKTGYYGIISHTHQDFYDTKKTPPSRFLAKADGSEELRKSPEDPTPEEQAEWEALAQRLATALDLEEVQLIVDEAANIGGYVAAEAGRATLGQLGLPDTDNMFNTIDPLMMDWAKDRAAELVGKRWVDGELVDSANAEMAIDGTTRDMIRKLIADKLAEGYTLDELSAELEGEGMDAYPFSEERADLIAATEIARAASYGALAFAKKAEDEGVNSTKFWLVADEPCPICEENADAGPIGLDEEFPSGDDAPTAHPNCRCALAFNAEREDNADETTDETPPPDEEPDDSEPINLMAKRASRYLDVMGQALFEELVGPQVLLKYSEDEPRDDAGKWTSGGGGMRAVSAAAFVAARDKSTRPQFLSPHPAEELASHTLLTNKEGTVGISVDPHGDIQNVFNNGGPKGGAAKAMIAAIAHGGRTLDCYDDFLPGYYHQFGFEEDARMKFNPEYAPKGWDFAKNGQPDIVFMSWRGYINGPEGALKRAAAGRANWDAPTRSTSYVDDWDAAKERSRQAAVLSGGAGDHRLLGKGEGSQAHRAGDQQRAGAGAGAGRALVKFNPNHAPGGSPEGGQFTSSQGELFSGLPPTFANRLHAAITYNAIKQGYNPAKLFVEAKAPEMSLGTHTFTPDAVAYTSDDGNGHKMGDIVFFADKWNLAKLDLIPGYVAHEVQHIKYQTVYNRLNDDLSAISSLQVGAEKDWPVKNLGEAVKPEYAGRWPTYDALQPLMSNEVQVRLRDEDGVSGYSRMWWDAYNAGKAAPQQAVHETLAEIARGSSDHALGRPMDVSAPSKTWQSLYTTVNRLYSEGLTA